MTWTVTVTGGVEEELGVADGEGTGLGAGAGAWAAARVSGCWGWRAGGVVTAGAGLADGDAAGRLADPASGGGGEYFGADWSTADVAHIATSTTMDATKAMAHLWALMLKTTGHPLRIQIVTRIDTTATIDGTSPV